MSHSDIDSPVTPSLLDASVKLPWESIDPQEAVEVAQAQAAKAVAQNKKPRRKAKASAAESGVRRGAAHSPSQPIKAIFRTLPQETTPPLAESEISSEEDFVAHAFLSDEGAEVIQPQAEQNLADAADKSTVTEASLEKSHAAIPPLTQGFTAHSAYALSSSEEDSTESTAAKLEPMPVVVENLTRTEAPAPVTVIEVDEFHATSITPSNELHENISPLDSDSPATTDALELAPPSAAIDDQGLEIANSDEWKTTALTLSESAPSDDLVSSPIQTTDTNPRDTNPGQPLQPHPVASVDPVNVIFTPLVDSNSDVKPQDEIRFAGEETLLAPLGREEEEAVAYATLAVQPARKKRAAKKTDLEKFELQTPSPCISTGGGWTIPLMCAGICLIACCLVIPQADYNRRLLYEPQSLQANFDSMHKQVAVNDAFLSKVMNDPNLAERLASRQLKTIRKGQKVLAVNAMSRETDMSPFSLVNVPPPIKQLTYQPVTNKMADLCNVPRTKTYLLGVAMTMVAVGLIMGFSPKKCD